MIVEGEPNNGAWVTNATACWSTEIQDRQWCDITVQSLEGSQAHAAIVLQLLDAPDDPAILKTTLEQQFASFAARSGDGQLLLNIDLARDIVPSLLNANEELIVQCVSAFRDHLFGKGGMTLGDQDGFRCSVGESSGWLRIEFRIGEVWLSYMIAPPPN